jgi:hypothetical protein
MNNKPVWGAENIGPSLGLTAKQIYYIADRGLIPAIRKVGRRLVADIDRAREQITGVIADVRGHDDGGTA